VLVGEEDVRLLTEIGITKTQAKVYLTLLKIGETEARTLSKKTGIPKQEIYRIIKELQEKGLAEKELAAPSKFIATPIQFGLQILMNEKVQQCKDAQRKIKEFLLKNQTCTLEAPKKQEHKLIVIEGKNRLMQTIKLEHDTAQKNIDIISTLQRWSQILDYCLESYVKALERKVKYRVVIEKTLGKITLPEKIQALLSKPNFELRFSEEPLMNNAAIFDDNEATINFFEGKPLGESPILWTNHPGFIQMCRDHFDKVWKSSREYKI
jgi:sugar-specific transcriptional regulator TrmB